MSLLPLATTAAVQMPGNGNRDGITGTFVNFKAGWQNSGDDFEIYGFARNLFDKRDEVFGASLNGIPTVMTGTGRIIGIGVTKHV